MAASVCIGKVLSGHRIDFSYYCSVIFKLVHCISPSYNLTYGKQSRLGRIEYNGRNEKLPSETVNRAYAWSIYRHTGNSNCYNVGRSRTGRPTENKIIFKKRSHQQIVNPVPSIACCKRFYSDDRGAPKKKLPPLMDFPEIVWPSFIKSFRNWILSNFIVTPYFDRDFSIPDFIQGSKQALEQISGCLSRGDFATLKSLVTDEALEEMKRNSSTFTLQQRQELALSKEDVYFSFPYQIGIIFSDDDKNQQRFVEITMCYHVLQGLKELREQGVTPPLNMGVLPEYREKLYICNYRFIREFTKGVEDQWTVNVVNHFKPSD